MTTFEQLLTDPNEQFDKRGEILASIEAYSKAQPATARVAGPYEARVPRADAPAGGYPTAVQELAAALEGQAPTLAREVAGLLGPVRTVNLAQAIGRAVAVGIRRRADLELRDRMHELYDVIASGLDQVTDGCLPPDEGCACAVLDDSGDCTVCGEHWESITGG